MGFIKRKQQGCYFAEPGPDNVSETASSGWPVSFESSNPDNTETERGRANFAVMMVKLDSLEWLYLAHGGHRRARLSWDDGTWRGEWLIP